MSLQVERFTQMHIFPVVQLALGLDIVPFVKVWWLWVLTILLSFGVEKSVTINLFKSNFMFMNKWSSYLPVLFWSSVRKVHILTCCNNSDELSWKLTVDRGQCVSVQPGIVEPGFLLTLTFCFGQIHSLAQGLLLFEWRPDLLRWR